MFKDVKPTDWFYGALKRMVRQKRISGYSDGTFRPNEFLRRAEYVSSEDRQENYREELIEEVKRSVPVISGPGGRGSGVLIAPDTIVTNVHVALCGYDGNTDRINNLTVMFYGGIVIEPEDVYVPWGDGAKDCAILKIPKVDIPALEIKKARPGEKVFAIGCPHGLISTATEGMVSHDRRYTEVMGEKVRWVQTDAPINPGNSGGALVNRFGELVGIPTWKIFYSSEKEPRPAEGMNFALHYEGIMATLEESKKVVPGEQKIVNRELAATDRPFLLLDE